MLRPHKRETPFHALFALQPAKEQQSNAFSCIFTKRRDGQACRRNQKLEQAQGVVYWLDACTAQKVLAHHRRPTEMHEPPPSTP